MATQIQISNLSAFLSSVREARRQVSDLSTPLGSVGRDWMRMNVAMFQQTGPGSWPDLSARYKVAKRRRLGFVYPMLVASGKLERSITVPGDPYSLFEIVNQQTLILGTRVLSRAGVNYPALLQSGTSRMPPRPWASVQPLAVQRWKNILASYVAEKTRSAKAS